jgi:clan AA aspartic protease (TIGR02281 family)
VAQVVTVTAGPTGLFRFPVTLEGRIKIDALFDTGATAVILCPEMAKSMGLKLGEHVDVGTVKGGATGRRTLLTSIQINETTLRNVPAIALSGHECSEIVLGMAALRELAAVLLVGDLLAIVPKTSPNPIEQSRR